MLVRAMLRQTRHAPEQRHEQEVCVREARRRVTRHAEHRRSSDPAEHHRLSGLDRDPVKDDLSRCLQRIEDQIAFADRAAAGKNDDVVRRARVESASDERGRGRRALCQPGTGTPPCSRMIADSVNWLMS